MVKHPHTGLLTTQSDTDDDDKDDDGETYYETTHEAITGASNVHIIQSGSQNTGPNAIHNTIQEDDDGIVLPEASQSFRRSITAPTNMDDATSPALTQPRRMSLPHSDSITAVARYESVGVCVSVQLIAS